MKDIQHDEDPLAVRLGVAVKRLRNRLREVVLAGSPGLSLSLLAILRRLRVEEPATAASLAAAEFVSQQAIAQSLATLKRAGLVESTPDPADRRKSLISVTEKGHRLFETIIASRNAWLVQAIESTIADDELPALDKAIELLERLADADQPATARYIAGNNTVLKGNKNDE